MSLFEKDLLVLGEGRKGPYFLPDSLIIENSEHVYVDGKLQPKAAYQMNFIDGEIRFFNSVAEGIKIRITYKHLPYSIKKAYAHRNIQKRVFGAPTVPVQRPSDAAQSAEPDYAAQLTKSGSITRGVTIGTNRGLKVNSSLNINVSGKVAENIEVVAALTDQSTPIQPEGTTQNLQEIDKVFVQLKAPHFSATMGDYVLDFQDGQFSRYSRKLQGAMGEAYFDDVNVIVSGAVSRGKYQTMNFMGQEGNQGPYQLKGDRGQIDIIVLAGTERVFIDGEAMVRGETNDYIIDYAAAQITFTRRRLITADSRIVVDFQYSDEKFRRNLYAAKAGIQLLNGSVKLSSSIIREADDKENPLDLTLSEDRLQVLQNAGDNPQNSVIDGARYVGSGKGRYAKNEAGVFQYVGPDSGDYSVSFSDVGDGNGAYKYKGGGIYDYVGAQQGRYNPVIQLPMAYSHNLIDFTLQVSPLNMLTLTGEIALSDVDANTYSAIDDGDNQGVAQNWTMTLKPDSIRLMGLHLGRLTLSGKYRQIQDRFEDIDRTTEIEYSRRWDLPSVASRGEKVKEFTGNYQPFQGFSMQGQVGNIEKGDYFRSRRWQFENKLSRLKWPEYNFSVERIRNNMLIEGRSGDWWRGRGQISHKFWKLTPRFGYEGELKKENWSDSLFTGFKFHSYTGGLAVQPSSKITAAAQLNWRDDKDYIARNLYAGKSNAATQNYSLSVQRIGAFSGSMAFTHRERKFADPNISNKTTDLAEIRAIFEPWQRAIQADVNYQISNTATAKKERVYIKVSQGDGNYRFDEELNEYVNDRLGDYILRILTTDDLVPVVELKTSTRLRLTPERFFRKGTERDQKKWQKVISAFSTESFVSIEERSQEKDVWKIYLLSMNKFLQPKTTILGNFHLRQDFFLFEHNRDFSMRLRYQGRKEKNNQFLEGGQDRNDREYSVRITSRLSRQLSSQSQIINKRTSRFFSFEGRQNRDILANEARVDVSYRPRSPLEIALEGRFSLEKDRFYEIPTKVRALALIPRVNYSLLRRGRLRGELEWSSVTSEPEGRLIPYEMANGRSLGNSLRWNLRFDYRVSETIQASFSYSGRNEPSRDRTIHTARAQVTAAFR